MKGLKAVPCVGDRLMSKAKVLEGASGLQGLQ